MADNKQSLREIPNHNIKAKASTQEPSLIRDLSKSVMDEIIKPKSTEVMRDMLTGIIGMFADALRSSVDKLLYPDGGAPTKRPQQSTGYYTSTTNYASYSRPLNQPTQPPKESIGQRSGNQVKYIWVESEEKAKQIIGALKEDIDNYGKAKVATLYEMIGEKTTFADFKFGWTDAGAIGYYYDSSRRGNEYKWYLDLSKPVDITNA